MIRTCSSWFAFGNQRRRFISNAQRVVPYGKRSFFDRAMRDRVLDPQTGLVDYEALRSGRWLVKNGRFQEVDDNGLLLGWLGKSGTAKMALDHRVIWESPDRFRLEGDLPARRTMVWSRVRK